jgi:hypothetical protein
MDELITAASGEDGDETQDVEWRPADSIQDDHYED